MLGIDLTKEIRYRFSSLRFFNENEYHVDRFCEDDVLLLVYEGVLRFTEDGIPYEIHPGEYHIQKHNTIQSGNLPSTAPKYLFVHFRASWSEENALPRSGTFDYKMLKLNMEEMHALSYARAPYIIKTAKFYEILSKLYKTTVINITAYEISKYIKEHYQQKITIDQLCKEFSFSKNHIINIFQKEFDLTPIAYLNYVRLNKAEELLITSSELLESIAHRCGYQNYSHFYRQFVRKHHVSPEEFRKNKQLGNL